MYRIAWKKANYAPKRGGPKDIGKSKDTAETERRPARGRWHLAKMAMFFVSLSSLNPITR